MRHTELEYGQARIAALLGAHDQAVRLLRDGAARGVLYSLDLSATYLGHADMDLESVVADPAIRVLLRPRD